MASSTTALQHYFNFANMKLRNKLHEGNQHLRKIPSVTQEGLERRYKIMSVLQREKSLLRDVNLKQYLILQFSNAERRHSTIGDICSQYYFGRNQYFFFRDNETQAQGWSPKDFSELEGVLTRCFSMSLQDVMNPLIVVCLSFSKCF